MSTQKLTNAQRAMEYYKLAAEFLDVYHKLSKADNDVTQSSTIDKDLRQASVKQLLLGHVLELVMKGWLIVYEGNPVGLTSKERKALGAQGKSIQTLKDYGHDLVKLAADVVKYDSDLQPYLDKTISTVDEHGQPQKKSLIENLNSSYWGDGERQYEYPENRRNIAFLSPLDTFADFISASRDKLLLVIMQKNTGKVPIR